MSSNNKNRNGHRQPHKKQRVSARSMSSNSSSSSIEILNGYNHSYLNHNSTNTNPSYYGLSPNNGDISLKSRKSKKEKRSKLNTSYNIYADKPIANYQDIDGDELSPLPFPQERDRRNLTSIHDSFNTDSSRISISRKSRKSRYNDSFNDRYCIYQ